VRRVRRRAGRERGGELLFQVAPGEPLDLDRDVRVRLLILGSDLVQDREGLRLGLGLPEPDDLLSAASARTTTARTSAKSATASVRRPIMAAPPSRRWRECRTVAAH